jgi:hypothetical protein
MFGGTLVEFNPIALSFTDANGQAGILHAVSVEGREWRLHAMLDGRSFEHNCSNWQAVERTRTWLSTHPHPKAQAFRECMTPRP